MRILLYSGKGGVGKTSVAAATGLRLADLGYRTLVLSVDPAHSLADSFDLGNSLFHGDTADPKAIREKLDIQEVNINRELTRHWREVTSYITTVLRTTGLNDVEAEELAVFPGMEELSAMMYVNQYRKQDTYDIIVLDCAPTAESLRFVSLPTTLDWYMKHIFGFQRNLLKAVRPIANRIAPVEVPPDSYFHNIQQLFLKLEGIDTLLEDPSTTSIRLVTNPEKMVLRETQRAFVYFSLHGLTVDQVIVNRVLPEEINDSYFSGWRESQQAVLAEMKTYFNPVPISQVPLFRNEVLGSERLSALAALLYANDTDPAKLTIKEPPYSFLKNGDHYEVRIPMHFAEKPEVGLFKKGDELVVQLGTLRRHVGLPSTMANLHPSKATLNDNVLVVEMRSSS